VGAYIPSTNTPAPGYNIVFDNVGKGTIYDTMAVSASISQQDRILSLSSPQSVDMGGYTLTSNAIPISTANVAYILDKVKFLAPL
jgi:hypothetical protein